jgi:hypothetical protein
VTEQLLLQQLESPSGTGRDEPRSQISLTAPALNERDTNSQNSFSLTQLCAVSRLCARGSSAHH